MSSHAVEDQLRAALARSSIAEATELAIRAYGPELIGWLLACLPNESDAYEAFSQLSEDLWKSLPGFEGRCSMRTWCYMLARQAVARVRAHGRRSREELVSSLSSIDGPVTHVWSTTRANAAHEASVYGEIRAELSEDDQTLLVLRVDRELAWRDIALVMLGQDATEDELARKSGALRKQFERVKEQLRSLAAHRLRTP
jgi:RNA polymerase sigma-70 factor (ECF subfamily)